jgi:histidinol-phosphatase (PHP family)
VETGLFDCIAHLDLVKQQGSPLLSTNRRDVESLLEACGKGGMSIEINTSGGRKQIDETYPSEDIVRLAIEGGLPITVGSDAHAPSHVGLGFPQIEARFGDTLSSRLVRYRDRKIVPPAGGIAEKGPG